MKNLAELTQEEKDKINVDLAASGVAYKERLNMPVVASESADVGWNRPSYVINQLSISGVLLVS